MPNEIDQPMHKRPQILIVDDHPLMAAALASFVRRLGYEACAVSNGEQALSRIYQEPPFLVLLDLNLPGSSGGDVLRVLRADHRFDSLSVVICSAQDRLSADEMNDLGAQDFIKKSEVFEHLANVIAKLLSY